MLAFLASFLATEEYSLFDAALFAFGFQLFSNRHYVLPVIRRFGGDTLQKLLGIRGVAALENIIHQPPELLFRHSPLFE